MVSACLWQRGANARVKLGLILPLGLKTVPPQLPPRLALLACVRLGRWAARPLDLLWGFWDLQPRAMNELSGVGARWEGWAGHAVGADA